MTVTQTDALIERISSLDREDLIAMLRGMHCQFEIDFTDQYLRGISIERLRHICFAAALHETSEAS